MSDPDNPWDPDGSRGSRWEASEATAVMDNVLRADGLDAGGGPKPIRLELKPEPFEVDQGKHTTWCWAAAIESWMKSFPNDNINTQTKMEGIWYRFQHLCYDNGSLIPTLDNWQEVTKTYGANRWHYFRPPHAGLDVEFLRRIIGMGSGGTGAGYVLVGENEAGSSYKHAYVVYGLDGALINGFVSWLFRDPDGGRLGYAPIGRSPRWNIDDYLKKKWDVGATSEYWLAWREND